MIQQLLQQKFGIKAEEALNLGKYEACKANGLLYSLVPVGNMESDDIYERAQIAKHLMNNGDRHVAQVLTTKEGEQVVDWKESKYCVLTQSQAGAPSDHKLGRKLAKFHYRGRLVSFQIQKIGRIGQWKKLWEQRLDQMEKVWTDLLYQKPDNEFERMFIESFPYYMGLAENSIQYLVDTELDDDPGSIDYGTVCHERFQSGTWGSQYYLKNPFDWVFDHCSRDLAEWTRERYFRNIQTYEPEVTRFFSEYESVTPLSSFSWRLLYARILFPLHYFDCIESYYITNSEQHKHTLQDRFNKFLHQTNEHEHFLGNFYQLAQVPVRRYKIPQPEWLKKA
ncbi:spore coat putative kinase YutH [Cytobacillus sp. FJAT-54145]|uniref:Spore coat putative kinase YutH n=1 Tax=Cytobacillus spartinae TaxID=3299023 RepID=A0ABW6KDU4_9BACI